MAKIAANLSQVSALNAALHLARSITGCGSASGESSQDYQAWAFMGILGHVSSVQAVRQTWQSAQSIQNVPEKGLIWGAIATKLIALGEPSYGVFIAQKLAAAVPLPNAETYSPWELRGFSVRETSLQTIASALAEKQEFAAAMQVVKTMTDLTPDTSSLFLFTPRPTPKSAAMQDIAHQLAIAGRTAEAIDLAKTIPDHEAKALAWIAIARELQTQGKPAEAVQLLQDLPLPPPPEPNDYYHINRISHIATALVTVGQTDRAMQLAQAGASPWEQETILTDIAIQLANSGQIEAALKLAQPLTLPGLRALAFSQIATKLVELGQLEQALQITSSESTINEGVRDDLLVKLATRYAQQNERSQALAAAELIANPETKAKTIVAIALASR